MTALDAKMVNFDHVSLLLVDDDPMAIHTLAKALQGLGRQRFATSGLAALQLAREAPPDLILLDAEMPGMSGFEVCEALSADPALSHIPVIFITSHNDEASEEAGLSLGAVDFIAKPIRPAIVAARVRTQLQLKMASDRLRALVITDGLTGVANRRALDEALAREWQRACRTGHPLSLLMLDIDFFKRYNDLYGHLQGDETLKAIANAARSIVGRPTDLVARYGGEEFLLLLPETDGAGARAVSQQLLDKVAALAIPHADSPLGHVTVSIGVASVDAASQGWPLQNAARRGPTTAPPLTATELLQIADEALYAAKQAGRARQHFVQVPL